MQKEETKTKFLTEWKDVLAGSFMIVACLTLFSFFPANGPSQGFSRILFFLLIIPALYVKLILKKNFKDFGLNFSVTRKNGLWFLWALLASFLISFLLVRFTSFKSHYPLPDYAIRNFWWFLVYELIFVNVWLFLHEAFYRGFVFFTFAEKLKYWSILISFALFAFFLVLTNNLSWGMAPYLIIALTGGWLTYKTSSFIYSYLMGLLFIIILDAYIIQLIKQPF
jgi:membrane protease YdiL (CAAX protease family)